MKRIDKVVAAIRQLAGESPDFVYRKDGVEVGDGCSYFPDDYNPQGCIVGAAMRQCGHTIAAHYESAVAENMVARILRLSFEPNEEILRWITVVQGHQDMGLCWKFAVALADVEVGAV